jgi:hypothetical protein
MPALVANPQVVVEAEESLLPRVAAAALRRSRLVALLEE